MNATATRTPPSETARILRRGIASADKLADICTTQALAAETLGERLEWERQAIDAAADAMHLREALADLTERVSRCARRFGYKGTL